MRDSLSLILLLIQHLFCIFLALVAMFDIAYVLINEKGRM